ncbi:MAG: hypothetical protein AB9Q19_12650 [Candidatus Reddybacter sp.]
MSTISHAITSCATIDELESRLYADHPDSTAYHVVKKCVDDIAAQRQEIADLKSLEEDTIELIDELREEQETAQETILRLERQARDNAPLAAAR